MLAFIIMEENSTYTISNLIFGIEMINIPTHSLVSKKGLGDGEKNELDEEKSQEYYSSVFTKYLELLYTLKIKKYDASTLYNYLVEAKVAKAILEEKLVIYTHNYNTVSKDLSTYEKELYNYTKSVFSQKIETLKLIVNSLNQELSFLSFNSSGDSQKELLELNAKLKPISSGRALFNLSKKESVMFIYILEKSNLLKFENDEQKRRFIEENFSFTELRDNNDKGKTFHMKDVGSELSKLKSYSETESNNRALRKLLDKLEAIDSYKF